MNLYIHTYIRLVDDAYELNPLTYLSREHMNPKLTCSQRQWLHSSVGRASHRYREVTGSSPVEVLNFFQASLRNCINCDHNCEDHSSFEYIRLLTTSPKGLFSANYKEKDKNKNIYKLFKVTNCKSLGYHSSLLNLSKSTPLSLFLKLLTSMHNLISLFKLFQMFTVL